MNLVGLPVRITWLDTCIIHGRVALTDSIKEDESLVIESYGCVIKENDYEIVLVGDLYHYPFQEDDQVDRRLVIPKGCITHIDRAEWVVVK